MRGLRLDNRRVEELIDEIYGKNRRLSFWKEVYLDLPQNIKLREKTF